MISRQIQKLQADCLTAPGLRLFILCFLTVCTKRGIVEVVLDKNGILQLDASPASDNGKSSASSLSRKVISRNASSRKFGQVKKRDNVEKGINI